MKKRKRAPGAGRPKFVSEDPVRISAQLSKGTRKKLTELIGLKKYKGLSNVVEVSIKELHKTNFRGK